MPTTIAPGLAQPGDHRVVLRLGARVQAGDPSVQTSPATATLSLTAMGTPASGRANRVRAVSIACASASAAVPPDHPERADPGVDRVDVGQVGADDVDRRHLARPDEPGDLGGRQPDRPGGDLSSRLIGPELR